MPRTKTDPAPPPRHYLHTPLTVADLLAGCERIGADPATTTVHINGEPVADSSCTPAASWSVAAAPRSLTSVPGVLRMG